jgi:hypothetical protein
VGFFSFVVFLSVLPKRFSKILSNQLFFSFFSAFGLSCFSVPSDGLLDWWSGCCGVLCVFFGPKKDSQNQLFFCVVVVFGEKFTYPPLETMFV